VSRNAYWNGRLDPLDWKRACEVPSGERWRLAHDTFLDPATRDGIAALGDLAGRHVLEIGCGQGYGSLHLALRGARVTGIDLSERRCAIARESAGRAGANVEPRFCAASGERLPFPDRCFDRLFCRDVLMYAEPRRLLDEALRVLGDGGRAAFVESLAGNPLLRAYRRLTSPRDYARFTRHLRWTEMRALAEPAHVASLRAYYLGSQVAFLGLFALGSRAAHETLLRALAPLDRWLLDHMPFLAHGAWRATLVLRKGDAHAR
jgi:SAM-dependent methyltransferase